jgi:hypothetical protein
VDRRLTLPTDTLTLTLCHVYCVLWVLLPLRPSKGPSGRSKKNSRMVPLKNENVTWVTLREILGFAHSPHLLSSSLTINLGSTNFNV